MLHDHPTKNSMVHVHKIKKKNNEITPPPSIFFFTLYYFSIRPSPTLLCFSFPLSSTYPIPIPPHPPFPLSSTFPSPSLPLSCLLNTISFLPSFLHTIFCKPNPPLLPCPIHRPFLPLLPYPSHTYSFPYSPIESVLILALQSESPLLRYFVTQPPPCSFPRFFFFVTFPPSSTPLSLLPSCPPFSSPRPPIS